MTATQTAQHTLEFKTVHLPELSRAIANCLLFAAKDGTLPVLTCVRFEFDGATLKLVSTDRYRLCVQTVAHFTGAEDNPLPAVEPFAFLLEGHHAKALLAQIKRDKMLPLDLAYDAAAGTVRVTSIEGSSEFRTYDGTFPAWETLLPDEKNRAGVDEIGFNAKYLADLGKVQAEDKIPMIAIKTYGKNKPTRIDFIGGPVVVLMPIRLPEAD